MRYITLGSVLVLALCGTACEHTQEAKANPFAPTTDFFAAPAQAAGTDVDLDWPRRGPRQPHGEGLLPSSGVSNICWCGPLRRQ